MTEEQKLCPECGHPDHSGELCHVLFAGGVPDVSGEDFHDEYCDCAAQLKSPIVL